MRAWLYKYRKIVIPVFNLLLILLVCCLDLCRFEVNDDVVMCLIANGVYTGTPDPHLVFINALYGYVLAGLYSMTSAIEWYTISFLFLHWIAMTVIVFYIAFDKKVPSYLRLVFLLTFYVLWLMMLQYLQFTTTAAWVALAGCLLLLRDNWRPLVGGAFLVLLASFVRFEMAGLSVLLFSPMFFMSYRRRYRKYIVLIFIGVLVLVCRYIDDCFYQTPEWKYYREYNQLRGQIHDNPNAYKLYTAKFSEPISRDDINLFFQTTIDPSVWKKTLLQEAVDIIDFMPIQNKLYNGNGLMKYYLIILALFFPFIAFLILRKFSYVYILYYIFFISLMLYICLDATLKERVFISSLLVVLFFLFYLSRQLGNIKLCSLKNYMVVFLFLLPFICCSYKYSKRVYKSISRILEQKEFFDIYQSSLIKHTDKIVFPYCADLSLELSSPFSFKDFDNKFIFAGWMANYPNKRIVYRSFKDIVDSDVYMFISKCNISNLGVIEKTIKYHYDINVKSVVAVENDLYVIVQFKTEAL